MTGTPRDHSDSFAGTARFDIIRKLGAGGMGTVYEAFDRLQNQRVAIKTVKVRDAELLLRLKREFRSLQGVSNPHLVRYGELVEDAGAWFFTMELIEGMHFLRYVWRIDQEEAVPGRDTQGSTLLSPVPLAQSAPADASVVMPSHHYDEARLRGALVQLARALVTLHAHAKVHRDVKPSNVLVTAGGRVVLVDLGLVLDANPIGNATLHGIEGTIAYMAPEQAVGGVVGPAADWYAYGVMLYQALSGRLPFRGTPQQVLAQKQQQLFDRIVLRPAPDFASEVPADLRDLCLSLLEPDPDRRPDGSAILSRLRTSSDTPTAIVPDEREPAPPAPAARFVGRVTELGALHAAFADTRLGQPVVLMVSGESGVGKTALVRTFIEELRATRMHTVVLAGRCFERESVPYKALDSVIDALASQLQHLPPLESAAVRPRRASALLQVFPVLGRVRALRDAPRVEIADPQELRSRAFEALRELFERLCESKSIVLLIDDFHWADADSLALLGELLAPPVAPALLCVVTWRTGGPDQRPMVIGDQVPVRMIDVPRLGPDEATALAMELFPTLDRSAAARIATEGGGHPLFIGELARATTDVDAAVSGSSLDSVLWHRVQRLDEAGRQIVEALSIGDAPLRCEPLAASCGLSRPALEREVLTLQADHLTRAASERGTGFLDVYHARIREAVRGHLSSEAITEWHRRLAEAFSTTDPEAHEARALHYLGAGETDPGIEHALQAADRADRALAFEQAVRLYELVLSVLAGGDSRRSSVYERLGRSLANAGRGFAAAQAFRTAMEGRAGDAALHLRWLAGEQLVRSGRIDAGLEDTEVVLKAHRLPFPKSSLVALLQLLLRRAQIAIRLKLGRPVARSQDEDLERRFDICWSTGMMLGYVDSVRGALVQARGLLLALKLGDQNRLARALLIEAAFRAAGGARSAADSERTRRLATDLVIPSLDPVTDAWVPHVAGICAFLQGRWKPAIAAFKQAQEIIQTKSAGTAWDVAALSFVLAQTLAYHGAVTELTDLVLMSIRVGNERGDRFMTSMIRSGFQIIAWLGADDPAAARAHGDAAIADWSLHRFHLIHYNVVVGHANVDLYDGRPEQSLERVQGAWKAIRNAMFFQFEFNRIEMLELRARATLAIAARTRNNVPLLRAAERDLRRLQKERAPWAAALARSLGASLALLRGRRDEAVAALNVAVRSFDESDMMLHAASARFVLGHLDPASHAATSDDAHRYFEREHIRRPERLAAMLNPGLSTL